jgi:hypothetical protein
MIRNYVGDKKSIEARCDDSGQIWSGTLFEGGRETKFYDATLQEVEELAQQHGMRYVPR